MPLILSPTFASLKSNPFQSILRIGINTPFEIVIESYDGDNMKNVMKCKEEIERWFVEYGKGNMD